VSVLSDRYPKEQAFQFASQALEAAAAVPGVASAALATSIPFNNFMRIGTPIQTKEGAVKAEYYGNSISPGYFETMQIPLLFGRQFMAADRRGAPGVVILNPLLSKINR
jgi:hypothetical protein